VTYKARNELVDEKQNVLEA